jgi:hypothetical protein
VPTVRPRRDGAAAVTTLVDGGLMAVMGRCTATPYTDATCSTRIDVRRLRGDDVLSPLKPSKRSRGEPTSRPPSYRRGDRPATLAARAVSSRYAKPTPPADTPAVVCAAYTTAGDAASPPALARDAFADLLRVRPRAVVFVDDLGRTHRCTSPAAGASVARPPVAGTPMWPLAYAVPVLCVLCVAVGRGDRDRPRWRSARGVVCASDGDVGLELSDATTVLPRDDDGRTIARGEPSATDVMVVVEPPGGVTPDASGARGSTSSNSDKPCFTYFSATATAPRQERPAQSRQHHDTAAPRTSPHASPRSHSRR